MFHLHLVTELITSKKYQQVAKKLAQKKLFLSFKMGNSNNNFFMVNPNETKKIGKKTSLRCNFGFRFIVMLKKMTQTSNQILNLNIYWLALTLVRIIHNLRSDLAKKQHSHFLKN